MTAISIIIPTLNESANIERAIAYARFVDDAEIIVVDGGSTDGTVERASALTEFVFRSTASRALQQNTGARHATGAVLLFLQADTFLKSGARRQIDLAMRDERIGWGAFRQRIDSPAAVFRIIERGNAIRARWLRLPYGDQGIFVRRRLFEEVGGFPEVPLMEEIRLMRKLRRKTRGCLLPGPLHVSPRHWQRNGVLRQTARNWAFVVAERLGVSPDRLARSYYTSRPPRAAHPGTDDASFDIVQLQTRSGDGM